MEAAILKFFEGIRCPFLDCFFGLFSMLGEAMIVGAVAILVFWLAPKRAGERIIMTALTSFPLNALLKFLVHRPRPFIKGVVEYREPPFYADSLDPNASFPSGHTQSSGSFLFDVASVLRRVAAWIASGTLVLLVMLSRLYFGAHYPSDVLTALVLALTVVLFWWTVFRYAYRYRYLILLVLAALFLLPCALPNAEHDFIQSAGLLAGAAVSLSAAHLCIPEHTSSFPRRYWRILVGVALIGTAYVFCLFLPEGAAFSLLKWFLIAFTAGLIAPLMFERLQI